MKYSEQYFEKINGLANLTQDWNAYEVKRYGRYIELEIEYKYGQNKVQVKRVLDSMATEDGLTINP